MARPDQCSSLRAEEPTHTLLSLFNNNHINNKQMYKVQVYRFKDPLRNG